MHARKYFLPLIFMAALLAVRQLPAQSILPSTPPSSLVGWWLVSVDGDTATRTLIISEQAITDDGALLSAKYGMSASGQTQIEARVNRFEDKRRLHLITQAGTKIIATEQADGSFHGSFTLKTGDARPVRISRITEEYGQELKRAGTSRSPQKPGPDVPAECAAFFGGWAGNWSQGGYGEQRLWINSIMPDCSIKASFRSSASNEMPKVFSNTIIRGGAVELPCGNNGKCVFKVHGEEVWGSYNDADGGRNSGVFRRIN